MKFFGLLLFFIAYTTQVLANDCLYQKFETYANLQVEWQKDFTELIVSKFPELSDVAERNKKQQLALIRQRFVAFSIYLKTSPEKIQRQKAINQWVDLSPEVKEDLSLKYPEFKNALEKVNSFKAMPSHKDGEKLREILRTEIVPSHEFTGRLETFNSNVETLNDGSCR